MRFRQSHPARSRGFTLIELVLVLVVLAVLVGIAVPLYEGTLASENGKETASQLLSLTNYARSQSIADGVPYRLMLDIPNSTYYLARQENTDYAQVGQAIGRKFAIPDGIVLSFSNGAPQDQQQMAQQTGQLPPPVAEGGQTYVQFYPSGRIDPVSIKVSNNRDGSVREVICASPTESFRILGPGDEVIR